MTLTRRELVTQALYGAGAMTFLPSFNPFSLFGLEAAAAEDLPPSTRTLVVVTLAGGNDGLNTVVPYADPRYTSARGAMALSASELLPIDSAVAFHAALPGIKGLWDAGQVAVVHGVGYPDQTQSHFRSMNVWQTGSPLAGATSGWLGRWLEATGTTSLRALAVGSSTPQMLTGDRMSGVTISSEQVKLPGGPGLRSAFTQLGAADADDSPLMARAAASHHELLGVTDSVSAAFQRQARLPGTAAVPPITTQLDLVARLIKAGMPTRAYVVTMGGYDTHAFQKNTQARLLGQLDAAIASFFSRLEGDRYGQGAVMLVHSEFGRRVATNADLGTDHGSGGPVLVLGASVKGGFVGPQPDLAALDNGNIPITVDFRSVYGAMLGSVLGIEPVRVLGPTPAPLALLR